jgi:hypothetical protein
MRFVGRTIACIYPMHDSRCMRRSSSSQYKDWVIEISCIDAAIEYGTKESHVDVTAV